MDKKKTVHIVGFAPSSRHLAGYNKDDVEIWVLNEYFTILPVEGANNVTRWFELHHRDTVLASTRSASYIEKLKESKIPIYMTQKHDDINMSIEYPLQDIIKSLGTDYFTNSISYMIAMAVYEGYESIGIYGVDMAQEEEYSKERPSCEYFIGFARARGIEVYLPKESDLCKVPYLYGFEEESASKICKTIDPKRTDLQNRINNDDNIVDEMLEHLDFKLKKYMFEYSPLVAKLKEAEENLKKLQEQFIKSTNEEEKKAINDKIVLIHNEVPAIANVLYPVHDMILEMWSQNQTLKGAKKERLFLAGAESIATHLRVQLCPFD